MLAQQRRRRRRRRKRAPPFLINSLRAPSYRRRLRGRKSQGGERERGERKPGIHPTPLHRLPLSKKTTLGGPLCPSIYIIVQMQMSETTSARKVRAPSFAEQGPQAAAAATTTTIIRPFPEVDLRRVSRLHARHLPDHAYIFQQGHVLANTTAVPPRHYP